MKGVSTVITSVLLVSVSVALASMYAGWAPDLAEDLTDNVADNSEQTTKCNNAAISIQNPYYDQNSQTTFFILKNTGTIRFNKALEVMALNKTRLNSTEVYGLSPGESKSGSFETSIRPSRIIVRSAEECPDLRARNSRIGVRN
ncbi:hypothetical protein [Candidatus Nanohalococcus occultus]|uniref:CARDB domain-containing protein n=1 Tax=Candidatus Nanohalococcus occultus TaxID=2978047 RepID=A0ABY8CFJ4_9ARCH|nr:hypothetical protein SVXNc_0967 [Candidatus Nanohaloarchaeota archaeon SVXNc]